MITRFQAQNYKALRDVTLDLTPMHVLSGRRRSPHTSRQTERDDIVRVLLVAEGQHERGKEDRDGALETLVCRLHQDIIQCDLDRVSRKDIHAHHGKGQGYFKKALRWIREAEKRGYDAIILVIDQDNAPERVQEITRAQNNQLVALRRALDVALRTFDAWMLTDEQVLPRVLGYAVSPQRSPEDISDAKGVCTQLLGKSPMAMSQSECYALVAREADMSTLTRQCSKGFAPFAQRVRSL